MATKFASLSRTPQGTPSRKQVPSSSTSISTSVSAEFAVGGCRPLRLTNLNLLPPSFLSFEAPLRELRNSNFLITAATGLSATGDGYKIVPSAFLKRWPKPWQFQQSRSVSNALRVLASEKRKPSALSSGIPALLISIDCSSCTEAL